MTKSFRIKNLSELPEKLAKRRATSGKTVFEEYELAAKKALETGEQIEEKTSKYNSQSVEVDGIKFQSIKEGNRYSELLILQRARKIKNLRLQHRFEIRINDELICHYIADFVYSQNGKLIVEDTKGYKTAMYQMKKKLMKAVYKIDILET